jgi:hypothetical protein|tara:strand:- start:5122 stop:5343 length:222 start_codon:yes stop_codon:yes gene_type:complete
MVYKVTQIINNITIKDGHVLCWFCSMEMSWQEDFTYEDFCRHGEGVVAVLKCGSCHAIAEVRTGDDTDAQSEG